VASVPLMQQRENEGQGEAAEAVGSVAAVVAARVVAAQLPVAQEGWMAARTAMELVVALGLAAVQVALPRKGWAEEAAGLLGQALRLGVGLAAAWDAGNMEQVATAPLLGAPRGGRRDAAVAAG
jgi:hypothetical protein